MLRRVDTARLVHQPNIFGKGPFTLIIGKRSALVSGRRKWTRPAVAEYREYSSQWPIYVAKLEGRHYWTHAGRVFSDNEGLTQEQVWALLVTRDQRRQRQVDRAVAAAQQGGTPTEPVRGHIRDDDKEFVWKRDGGRCRNCGATSELQFDHVIPVAMGGSSEPENLQLLCGPCNRMKGAGLTTRGNPPPPRFGGPN
jgi:5-methylcytosine-specific restriction endonuclease McrA